MRQPDAEERDISRGEFALLASFPGFPSSFVIAAGQTRNQAKIPHTKLVNRDRNA
jgi:hypothetical protein